MDKFCHTFPRLFIAICCFYSKRIQTTQRISIIFSVKFHFCFYDHIRTLRRCCTVQIYDRIFPQERKILSVITLHRLLPPKASFQSVLQFSALRSGYRVLPALLLPADCRHPLPKVLCLPDKTVPHLPVFRSKHHDFLLHLPRNTFLDASCSTPPTFMLLPVFFPICCAT